MPTTITSRVSAMALALLGLLSLIACFGGGDDDNNDDDNQDVMTCLDATVMSAGAFIELDRSCTQDSDCKVIPISTCGCVAPVSTSADVQQYEKLQQDIQRLCSEEEMADCTQVTCEHDPQNLMCNDAQRCVAPLTTQ